MNKLLLILGLICCVSSWCYSDENKKINKPDTSSTESSCDKQAKSIAINIISGTPDSADQVIVRSGFALGYSSITGQALWVSYILTEQDLKAPKHKRKNKFDVDPDLFFTPIESDDYRRTGFDRGHLAPANDMSYSEVAMSQSFLMSNISPQFPGFNRGVWKRLETFVRKTALKEKKICVVTGPIFDDKLKESFPKLINPTGFYKVIMVLSPPYKMIGFIVPNQSSKSSLESFAVTVKKVEQSTGLNFFYSFVGKDAERLKSECVWQDWK